ncbi:MAG: amidohydrolase [Lentisphaeria bacterium]
MEKSLLLKNVIVDGKQTNVLINGNQYTDLHAPADQTADEVLDSKGTQALVPAFYNMHTHAAMTLLRGYADDKELFDWLNNYIWPAEAKLTADDIYWGTKLAILEMLRSGTVFMNDMYWHQTAVIKAAEEMNFRAAVGYMYICVPGGGVSESNRRANDELHEYVPQISDRIIITYAPHAIYTVNKKTLLEIREKAVAEKAILHIHAAETKKEVVDCVKEHGLTPVAYLHKLGLLSPQTLLAHGVYLTDDELQMVHASGAVLIHNPVSNMKLCSGLFRFQDAVNRKCRVVLGTDGCSSNNNASMLEEMKFAALSAKLQSGSPIAGKDEDVYRMATQAGAEAMGLNAGVIAEGKLADGLLIDLNSPQMVGDYSLIANLVYAADSSVIDTVICNGKIVMKDKYVPGQEEIIEKCKNICHKLK